MNRVLALMVLLSGIILTTIAFSQQNIVVVVDGQIPQGYCWSPPLTKPGPLTVGYAPNAPGRGYLINLQPGNYDVATVPFGDNWQTTTLVAFASVKLTKPSGISVMARFPFNEPSAGYVILIRGPYTDNAPEASRGDWRINSLPGGMIRGRASRPVYGHIGARYDRYGINGYTWQGDGYYPVLDLSGATQAVGPRKFFTEERVNLNPCATPPDVTIVSAVPQQKVWVAYSYVDMLGRETEPSDPVCVDKPPFDASTYVVARRQSPVPHGCCGFRVYAGFSATELRRQPVLNYQGSPDKWLWPVHLVQFVLHDVHTDTPSPSPSATVSSLLSPPQQDVLAGKNVIIQAKTNYDLYCPFLLHYDANNFNRDITGKAKYTHKTTWNNLPLETDIPLLVLSNFGDHLNGMTFVSSTAIAGVATSDWANGACAMSNWLERCSFLLSSAESVGLTIEERSATANGTHTASELTCKECGFGATIPVKLEGNQTGKIRFIDNCEFAGYSTWTRYPADTVGLVYQASPSVVHFDYVKGVNGNFRSIIGLCSPADPAEVYVKNLFVDAGCPVYVTFSGFAGGNVELTGGENINAGLLGWGRLCEAPVARNASVLLRGITYHPTVSSVSFMLNQLSIDSDRVIGEVVAPDDAFWLSKGLKPQYPPDGIDGGPANPAYYDFSKKRQLRYLSGVDADSTVVSPTTRIP